MKTLRWKAWLAAFALFVTGMAAGSFVTVGVGVRALRHTLNRSVDSPAPIDNAIVHLQAQLTKELHLDPGQATQVHTELLRATGELKRLRTDSATQLQQILNDTVTRLAVPLTPEQRTALYRLAEQRFGLFGLRVNPRGPTS